MRLYRNSAILHLCTFLLNDLDTLETKISRKCQKQVYGSNSSSTVSNFYGNFIRNFKDLKNSNINIFLEKFPKMLYNITCRYLYIKIMKDKACTNKYNSFRAWFQNWWCFHNSSSCICKPKKVTKRERNK